jgi:exodeoxyribonuclease V alpha subunit
MFTYYGPETILQKAVSFYLRCIKQFSVDDVILLNPYRKGSLTVDMFNSTIQAAINPPADGKPSITVKDTTFRQGDRVMQTRNQATGVANGDTGEILRIYKAKDSSSETNVYCEIQFEGTILETYDSKQMETVQLAYCTSVHKSQGGEWKVAIIIISPEHKRLLQRNLLYTAITRAKIGVAIFGDFGSVAYAVDNNVVVQRNTHLSAAVEQKAKEYAAEQQPKR